jgi:hypothetical protein
MVRSWIAASSITLCMLIASAACAQTLQTTGVAIALDARAAAGKAAPALYEERHVFDAAGLHRSVSYRREGKEFATKTVDYSPAAVAPNFTQHDVRRGEMIAARRNAQGFVELGYRETSAASERWQAIDASDRPLVIDAGFDNFVRQQWLALQKGDAIHFDFAVPSRAQVVHLVIVSAKAGLCGEPRLQDSHCFRVYAGNYVVRLFFPALYLLYDSDAQLQRFMGLSNINDEHGHGQQVRIDYRRTSSQN